METTEPVVIDPLRHEPQVARRPKLVGGHLAVMAMEGVTGEELPEPEREALMRISDDDGAAAFLDSKWGPDMDLKQLQARDVFSRWLVQNVKLQPMMMTMHMQTIMETERAGQFARGALEGGGELTPEQEAALIRCMVVAAAERSKMLSKVQKAALSVQPEAAPKRPLNRPPEFMSQTNIVVQSGGNVST